MTHPTDRQGRLARTLQSSFGGGHQHQLELREAVRESGMRSPRGRNPDKPVLPDLERRRVCRPITACDAANRRRWSRCSRMSSEPRPPTLVVHIHRWPSAEIFRKAITEGRPSGALATPGTSRSARFLVGQQAARLMLENTPNARYEGTIISRTPRSAKGLTAERCPLRCMPAKAGSHRAWQGVVMPQGIPSKRADRCWRFAETGPVRARTDSRSGRDDNMADRLHRGKAYLQLHRQHRSTWAFEVVLGRGREIGEPLGNALARDRMRCGSPPSPMRGSRILASTQPPRERDLRADYPSRAALRHEHNHLTRERLRVNRAESGQLNRRSTFDDADTKPMGPQR